MPKPGDKDKPWHEGVDLNAMAAKVANHLKIMIDGAIEHQDSAKCENWSSTLLNLEKLIQETGQQKS